MMLRPALMRRLPGVALSRLLLTPRSRQCPIRNTAAAKAAVELLPQSANSETNIAIREPCCILKQWLSVAQNAAPEWDPCVGCLATVDAAGQPVTRMTNVEQINAAGLTFYTTLGSRLAGEISTNPHASLQFYWPQLERSVHVSGIVSSVCALQAQLQFDRFPRDVQLSMHGMQYEKRSLFNRIVDFLAGMFGRPQQEVPVPKNWGGFLLQPTLYEFFQANFNAPGRHCMRFRRCLTLPRGMRNHNINADRYDWVFDCFIDHNV